MPGLTPQRLALVPGLLLGLLLTGCLDAYPEVAVANLTKPEMMVRQVSFQGCLWEGVLGYTESTGPARCLPGEGRVHFEKHDPSDDDFDDDGEPLWFPYQTRAPQSASYGEFHHFEITLEGLEQDFSAPSPYGH